MAGTGNGIVDRNGYYRDWLHVRRPGLEQYGSAAEIPDEATYAGLARSKTSHRGIGEKTKLRELVAGAANQDYLEQIASLEDLEYLELGWPVTASDLAPIASLRNLRTLKIDTPRAIADFTPILALPKLDRLFITNARHMHSLDWLRPLKDRLLALGIEGSTWTTQTIPSLAPLEGFALEGLFLTGTELLDQKLAPIATMPRIRFLGSALNAPRREFFALRDQKPDLECQWFDEAAWHSFKDPTPPRSA